ncbi:hypothetical protein [Streptomyces pinistramenti]|uniref:hypothetical protein n=1 Tax=Streptomyces pinistramenti TaxID=2884812 RepID=UPI001D077F53|nr:hypothetical protein [Streptomyces pinistramenti]MCB5911872.1 hypothetical protein [Streptomyces pinistramenti]
MPRPTAAQLAYGSATVFLSTLAMLLLSQTESGTGVVVIAVAGLGLGLLVAMTVPLPCLARVVRRRAARAEAAAPREPGTAPARLPRPRVSPPAAATRAEAGRPSR